VREPNADVLRVAGRQPWQDETPAASSHTIGSMEATLPTVDEAPVRIVVNGRITSVTSCTPDRLEALAAGWLLAEGYIRSAADLASLSSEATSDGLFTVRAECDPYLAAAADAVRRHRGEHGCGPLYGVKCDPSVLHGPARSLALPAPELVPGLLQALFGTTDRFRDTGGMHAAALSDGTSLVHAVTDVSRHAAVDKAIGLAVLAEADLARLGLVISSRISGEIAWKGARCGVAWIVSRSIPTTLAVQVAEAAGMPIVARGGSRQAHVYVPDTTRRPQS